MAPYNALYYLSPLAYFALYACCSARAARAADSFCAARRVLRRRYGGDAKTFASNATRTACCGGG